MHKNVQTLKWVGQPSTELKRSFGALMRFSDFPESTRSLSYFLCQNMCKQSRLRSFLLFVQ